MSGWKKAGRRRPIRQPIRSAHQTPAARQLQARRPTTRRRPTTTRSRTSNSIGGRSVPATETRNDVVGVPFQTGVDPNSPNDPAFAPIQARLARVYMEHKADLGLPDASDDDILRHVDDITLTLMRSVGQALLQGDEAFLRNIAGSPRSSTTCWPICPTSWTVDGRRSSHLRTGSGREQGSQQEDRSKPFGRDQYRNHSLSIRSTEGTT